MIRSLDHDLHPVAGLEPIGSVAHSSRREIKVEIAALSASRADY